MFFAFDIGNLLQKPSHGIVIIGTGFSMSTSAPAVL